MAVIIVTPGDKSKFPTYQRTCPECGCVFKYVYKDTYQFGCAGGYVAINCPTCGYPVAHINGGSSEVNNPTLTE